MKSEVVEQIALKKNINKAVAVLKSPDKQKQAYWNRRAEEFSEYAVTTGYPEEFVKILRPRKSWTVLDMACGGGTLAIPLSGKVKTITAVDFSEQMIEIVGRRSIAGGIENINTIHGSWEDNWGALGIGMHDVAIASRSLIGKDTGSMIEKLNRTARKAVYISVPVGAGPVDIRLYRAVGKKLHAGEDYAATYLILYKMGIMANVAFVQERHVNYWKTFEEAFDAQRWMFRNMIVKEEERIRVYLKKHLVQVMGQWRLPYSKICYWAVMWWEKDRQIA